MPHGFKKHLKRVDAPSSWMLDKMGGIFAPRPSAGPHRLRESLPVVLIVRNKLKYALDAKEASQVCLQRNIKVDGKVRTDPRFPTGFMDVVTIPKANINFRVMYDEKGRFNLVKIDAEEAKYKLCKVMSKKITDKKVPTLGTHDGRTFRYADPAVSVGDSIKVDLETGKVTEVMKLQPGCTCFIYKGRNTGRVGTFISRERHLGSFDIAQLKDKSGKTFAVRLGAVFVIAATDKSEAPTLPPKQGIKSSILEEQAAKVNSKKNKN
jgi:small subunit ribosomal protein S4e